MFLYFNNAPSLFQKNISNCDYVQTHCNDRNNPFDFACHT